MKKQRAPIKVIMQVMVKDSIITHFFFLFSLNSFKTQLHKTISIKLYCWAYNVWNCDIFDNKPQMNEAILEKGDDTRW